MPGAATILHADLDSFYAAVEVRDDPRLAHRPVAVGGGVVLSATYEARRLGVHAPLTRSEARLRCPGLVLVSPRFEAYVDASREVMEILGSFTPEVEPISIDEAFLDVSGSLHLFGSPEQIARSIRAAVRSQVGLPISVGCATTKHLAKIASRVAKPDGLLVVPPGGEQAFLDPLPVELVWGVGPVGGARLGRYGVFTIGDLRALPPSTLASWMGENWGTHLWALANNLDPRAVTPAVRARSVGAQSAGDATDFDHRHTTLLALADRIGSRLRRKHLAGRRVTVRVRRDDMTSLTRGRVLPGALSETTPIFRTAVELTDTLVAERVSGRITLVGISISLLERAPHLQLRLPLAGPGERDETIAGSLRHLRLRDLDAAVDRARERFGRATVTRAALLGMRPEERSPIEALGERGRRHMWSSRLPGENRSPAGEDLVVT